MGPSEPSSPPSPASTTPSDALTQWFNSISGVRAKAIFPPKSMLNPGHPLYGCPIQGASDEELIVSHAATTT